MPPSLLPPLPTFPGAIWLNQGEATMATSVPANYYNSKPIDPAHFNHYIVNTIDALLENALKVEHGSATLKFLYKIFGPVDVATRIFELEHEGGFYWINGSKIIADNVDRAVIAAALVAAVSTVAAPVLGTGTIA